MCGIVGMAGALEYKHKDVFDEMLFFCQLRGRDSTGVFSVPKSGNEASIIKTVGTPDNLFEMARYDRLSMGMQRAVIGHCRKATVGKIARSTAHPFAYGDITGVHNGTLRNWRDLPGESEAIDSMTLFENFSRVGVRETIEAVDGAYALIWWNQSDETLNVLRNKERPLVYAFSEDFKVILWASEAWMLTIACDRHGFKLADLTPKEEYTTRVQSVETDSWWSIKVGERGAKEALRFLRADDGFDGKLEGGTKKPVAPRPFHTPYSGGYSSNYGQVFRTPTDDLDDPLVDAVTRDQNKPSVPQLPAPTPTPAASASTSSPSTNSSSTAATPSSTASRVPKPTLTLVQTDKSESSGSCGLGGRLLGCDGLLLTEHEYLTLVDEECMWCKTPHSFHDLREGGKLGMWFDDTTYVCSECCPSDHAVAC